MNEVNPTNLRHLTQNALYRVIPTKWRLYRGHRLCEVTSTSPYVYAERVKAKFQDTDPTRTKSVHVVGYELNSTTRTRHGPDTYPTGPARTRTDFFCGETPLGPCGSGRVRVRVRVVEFSSYSTTCEDFVRVRSVSGLCRVRVVEFSY